MDSDKSGLMRGQKSILTSVKKMLGITEDYEYFDTDLIIHINTVFTILTQMGVGPPEGFVIHDDTAIWTDFIKNDICLESVKTYVYLKVRQVFDPPAGSAADANNRMITELEWRLHLAANPISLADEEENQNG